MASKRKRRVRRSPRAPKPKPKPKKVLRMPPAKLRHRTKAKAKARPRPKAKVSAKKRAASAKAPAKTKTKTRAKVRTHPRPKKRPAPKPAPKRRARPSPAPSLPRKPETIPSFEKEYAAELRAKRSAEAKAKKKLRRPLRGEGGKFVSSQEFEEQRAIRRVRKAFKALITTEKKEAAKAYGITDKKKRSLDRALRKMEAAALNSNFDLTSDLQPTLVVDGTRWEGAFSLTGFPPESEIPTHEERQVVLDMMISAIFAVQAAFPKKQRGWQISLGTLSNDAVFLFYARKKPIFEHYFLRLDDPREISLLTQRLRALLDEMMKNRFSVSGLRVQFIYDHQIAKMGYEKAVLEARRRAGLKN